MSIRKAVNSGPGQRGALDRLDAKIRQLEDERDALLKDWRERDGSVWGWEDGGLPGVIDFRLDRVSAVSVFPVGTGGPGEWIFIFYAPNGDTVHGKYRSVHFHGSLDEAKNKAEAMAKEFYRERPWENRAPVEFLRLEANS